MIAMQKRFGRMGQSLTRLRPISNAKFYSVNKVIRDLITNRSQSALTSLEARVLLVDDVDAALAANQAVIAMTGLKRFKRILDFHFTGPQFCNQKRATGRALFGWQANTRLTPACQHLTVSLP
jgi:hypothetical protein